MAKQRLTITVRDQAVQRRLQTLQAGLVSYREPLTKSGTDLIDFYGKKVFETQGRAMEGRRWKPHAIATLKLRADRRGHYAKPPVSTNKILIWTGKLMRGFRKRVTRKRLTIDNPVPYFKHLQGERPMLGINDEVKDKVADRFIDYIKKILRR